MAEDCGPCTQLGVGLALADGCTQTVIGNVIAGDDVALPDDVRLTVQFARAVLAHAAEAKDLLHTTDGPETIAFEARGGVITTIYAVRNPDKLAHLANASRA
jgi:hypothetical protein